MRVRSTTGGLFDDLVDDRANVFLQLIRCNRLHRALCSGFRVLGLRGGRGGRGGRCVFNSLSNEQH